MTILSVNKTREIRWAHCAHFLFTGALRPFFCVTGKKKHMNKKIRYLTHGAVLAAIYVTVTHLQNLLFPNSASMAVQFRLSEALCVLAFFTPAAIPGLSLGCLLFNLTSGAALPLDFLVGTLATYLAAQGMWLTRNLTVKGVPVLGLWLPAVTNAFLVGWELMVYIGGAFWLNALYVALGELAVLYTAGLALYLAMKSRRLDLRLFGNS